MSSSLPRSHLHRLMICLHEQTRGDFEEWVGCVREVDTKVYNSQQRQNGGGTSSLCLEGSFGVIQKESCSGNKEEQWLQNMRVII